MSSVFVSLELDHCENGSGVECPRCCVPLALDQPDVDRPDRMLGVCYECEAWYLLDLTAELMAELPDLGDLAAPAVAVSADPLPAQAEL
jgi:hypothetical protein